MKRRKPLRSRKTLRPARKRSKYRSRDRAVDYMLGVKQLPCAALIVEGHVCSGPIEADHAGPRSIGRKAHDSTVIPLCRQAHRERTDFAGPFRGWDQARMRDFLLGRVLQTQRLMRERGFAIPTVERGEARVYTDGPEPTVMPDCTCASDMTRCARHPLPSPFASRGLGAFFGAEAEDVREDGNIDVRHPDAAPLPVARVVSEGDQHR